MIEIGHHAPRARQAVVRLVLRPRNVRDGHFRDPRASPARQRRNEPMQIAVEPDALDRRRAVGLERGAEIVERHAGDPGHQPVGDFRRHSARPQIVHPLLPPAADDVVPFVELGEQLRNLFRRVLQVAVHRHDHRALSRVEAGGQRGRLPVVPGERDQHDAFIANRECFHRLPRTIAAAIVHVDDFCLGAEQQEHGVEAAVELGDRRHLVEQRHDDRQMNAAQGRGGSSTTRHDESSCVRTVKGRDGSA